MIFEVRTAYCASTIKAAAAFFLLSLAGCSDSWWSRGQSKSPERLLAESSLRLEEVCVSGGGKDTDLCKAGSNAQQEVEKVLSLIEKRSRDDALGGAYAQELKEALAALELVYHNSQPLFSAPSYPAYLELSSQLRQFSEAGEMKDSMEYQKFCLFASRLQQLFAVEASVEGVL